MMTKEILSFYAAAGWRLFPCFSHHSDPKKIKSPMTAHGFEDATSDIKQLHEWHDRNPGCAWGTPTSAEAGVFEYDLRHDPDGKLWAEHIAGKPMPATCKSVSGGGSPHYWFRWPAGTRSREIMDSAFGRKADGGYVLIPPSKVSIHPDVYRWEARPWEGKIREVPDWLIDLFAKPDVKKPQLDNDNPWVVKASKPDLMSHPGADNAKGEQRRPILCQLVGVHLARGDNPATIEALVGAWAARCKPPLEEHEWRPHLEKITAKEEGKRMTGTTISIAEIPPAEQVETTVPTFPPATEQDTSFLQQSENKEEEVCDLVSSDLSALGQSDGYSPLLPQAAYHGLFGGMLKAVRPQTEADPAAVLLGWLTAFGNIIGRGAWFQVGPSRHYPVLFTAIVGATSAAKGDAWKAARHPFTEVEADWFRACICPGVGSGEGLLERIADEQKTIKLNKRTNLAEETVIPGAADKRCLLRLSELSRLFKSQRRENNPLSEILREAWDGDPISIPNRGSNALATSGYTVSVAGDITPGALGKILSTGTEAVDGFANRFLWAAVQAGEPLPHGGDMSVIKPFLSALAEALAFGKQAEELKRDADANALWEAVYADLMASGDSVPHTDRARPQVVRLSMMYALLDKSTTICKPHLEAALAVWEYCRQSARLIFGGDDPTGVAEPDPLWLEVLNLITANHGIPQADITAKFKRKANAEQLAEILEGLSRNGSVFMREETTGGRKAKCWWPSSETEDTLTSPTFPVSEPSRKESKFMTGDVDPVKTACDKLTFFPGHELDRIDRPGEDTFFPGRSADGKVERVDVVSSDKLHLQPTTAPVAVGGFERGLL
jgi:hypothetical protein